MAEKNPRPQMMGSLRAMASSLDKRLAELEAQTDAIHHFASGNPAAGAAASRALLDQAVAMRSEVGGMTDTIVESRMAYEEFLAGMKGQMAEIFSDTATNETFMAQYGWLDRDPVTEDSLDWSQPTPSPAPAEETPASAAEFPEEAAGQTSMLPPGAAALPLQAAVAPRQKEEETIFDIGLSQETMLNILNKAKSHQKLPSPSQPPTASLHPPTASLQLPNTSLQPSTASLHPPSSPLGASALLDTSNLTQQSELGQQSLMFDDSMVGASPMLQLRSKLSSLPPVNDYSLSQSFASGLEISPGLPRRITPCPSMDSTMDCPPVLSSDKMIRTVTPEPPHLVPALESESPELPVLQTMDIRRLVAASREKQQVEQSQSTPEEPCLQTVDLRNSLAVARVEQAAKATPEEPLLSSSHYISSSSHPSSSSSERVTTPEAPQLGQRSYKMVSQTPETPVLKTMVLRKNI